MQKENKTRSQVKQIKRKTESREMINNYAFAWFCFTTLRDWLTKLAPLCQPLRNNFTKTKRSLRFPALSAGSIFASNFDWLIPLPVPDVIGLARSVRRSFLCSFARSIVNHSSY